MHFFQPYNLFSHEDSTDDEENRNDYLSDCMWESRNKVADEEESGNSIREDLYPLKEEIPYWLQHHQIGVKPSLSDFFASRVVYCPLGLLSGQQVKLFNSTHSAHCYLYVDDRTEKKSLDQSIYGRGFMGYDIMDTFEYAEEELMPRGCQFHFSEDSYRTMFIMKRQDRYDDFYGAGRFALLYVKADAVATYKSLFGNQYYSTPFCLSINDDIGELREGGTLERYIEENHISPQYYLFRESSRPWNCAKLVRPKNR
jgi:hypothetical protein